MKKIISAVSLLLFVFITAPSISESTGDIIQAKCECGFEQNLFLGAAKSNFETYFAFPFYCDGCSSICVLNILDDNSACKDCSCEDPIPYDSDTLRLHFSDVVVFGWNANSTTRYIYNDLHLCPKCKEYKMRFSQIGNFD